MTYIKMIGKIGRKIEMFKRINTYFISFEYIGIFFVYFLLIINVLEIFSRYILNHSILWSEELSRFLLIWITFVGAFYAKRKSKLIKVNVVNSILREGLVKDLLTLISHIIVFFVILCFLLGSPSYLISIYKYRAPALRIPYWTIFIPVVIPMLNMLLLSIIDIKNIINEILSEKIPHNFK